MKSEATAPASVTIPTVTDASGIVTITATAPSVRGTKINGAAVGEDEIIYWLYYARAGYSTITTGTTAANVVAAVGSSPAPDPDPKNAGKVELTGNLELGTGFEVTGISADFIYRYFIRSINPSEETKYSDTLMFVLPSNGKIQIVSAEKPAGTPRTEIADNEYKWETGDKDEDKITHVVIPDSVESIGMLAFADNALTSITLGTGVTTIGEYAFAGNAPFTSVVIPDTVTSILTNAFTYNPNLKTVTLTKTLYDKIRIQSNDGGLAKVFGTQVTLYQDASNNRFSVATAPAAVTLSDSVITGDGTTVTITATGS